MMSEISEFSYGFALTNELVGWLALSVAPIFPSLVEEGKAGGGYDVKLDSPGAPLFLQFKRSECMIRRSAREYSGVRDRGGQLRVPFHRFSIADASKSNQHQLLLELDSGSNIVFYAAPGFHTHNEINEAWRANAVASRSVFIQPREIGVIDDDSHTVVFDGSGSWVCSEPRPIRALNSREMLEKLQHSLQEDTRPLRTRLSALVEELREAEVRGLERNLEKNRQATQVGDALAVDEHVVPLGATNPTPPITRSPKPLQPEWQALRDASDIAARVFDAQLVIVQHAE